MLVSPAPGEPGKMPFWHGDQAGRPVELGYAIGKLVRELRAHAARRGASTAWCAQHDLDAAAAENLLRYLDDQAARRRASPTTARIVIERCLDELGDWRVCLLSPLGSRIHAPWAMAATAQIRNRTGMDVEVMWGDEGFVVRFPEVEQPPDPALLLPDADEVEGLVLRQLGSTSLFAARFRETAARALLLPRRRPGMRTPLWQQRKRAADLLAVASRFGSFPALLETYREVLRDHFDMPALVDTLRKLSSAHAARDDDRFEGAVAVCRVAALQLRRQLHLRRRRAAGRAARAGAVGRSGAAARAAWRRRAARAARSRRARRASSGSCSISTSSITCGPPTACTTC